MFVWTEPKLQSLSNKVFEFEFSAPCRLCQHGHLAGLNKRNVDWGAPSLPDQRACRPVVWRPWKLAPLPFPRLAWWCWWGLWRCWWWGRLARRSLLAETPPVTQAPPPFSLLPPLAVRADCRSSLGVVASLSQSLARQGVED